MVSLPESKAFTRATKLVIVLVISVSFADSFLINHALSESEKQWLAKHPVISIGPDPAYAPIEMVAAGQHSGMTADYFKLISEKTGLEFRVGNYNSWAHASEEVKAKKIDVLPSIQVTEERREFFNFTQSYIHLNTAIIVRSNNFRSKEMTIDDLDGMRVASVKGYFWTELLPKDYPNINVVEVESLEQGLSLVSSGDVDSMFATYVTAAHYIRKQKIDNLWVSGQAPYKIKYAIGVRADWPELASILSKTLNSISEEERKTIDERWITFNFHVPWYNKRGVAFALLIILSSICVILSWAYFLRRQVRSKTRELEYANERLEMVVKERTEALEKRNEELRRSRRSLLQSNHQLTVLAELDGLTQVPNKHSLNKILTEVTTNSKYFGHPLSVAMFDVDFFKNYNDAYGHLEGDKCLFSVAQTLKKLARREGELLARFGGEEFALVLPFLGHQVLMERAQFALEQVRDLKIENIGSHNRDHLTISIGLVTIENDGCFTSEQLLKMADEALYEAKAAGRDCFKSYRMSTVQIAG